MWLVAWWAGSGLAAAPSAADPVVLRIYAVDRTVADPFAGHPPPAYVKVGTCSGQSGPTAWTQACATVRSTATEVEATVAQARSWFASLAVPAGDSWAFGLPTSGGGHDADRVEAILLRGPAVEVRRSDIAKAAVEDQWVQVEWTPAAAARLATATASFSGEYAFVVDQDRLAATTAFTADTVPVGGTVQQPDTHFALTALWGDDALGARIVTALGGGT